MLDGTPGGKRQQADDLSCAVCPQINRDTVSRERPPAWAETSAELLLLPCQIPPRPLHRTAPRL